MDLRKLTPEEVEFTVTVEPEESNLEGHFILDDSIPDALMEEEIRARLRKGETIAWCTLVVRASWNNFVVTDTLGCCSFADQEDVDREVEAHGMKEEALGMLQANIEAVFNTISELII